MDNNFSILTIFTLISRNIHSTSLEIVSHFHEKEKRYVLMRSKKKSSKEKNLKKNGMKYFNYFKSNDNIKSNIRRSK